VELIGIFAALETAHDSMSATKRNKAGSNELRLIWFFLNTYPSYPIDLVLRALGKGTAGSLLFFD